jgi:hypothetical protein
LSGIVDPEDAQIKKDKEHMDGGIHPAIIVVDHYQPIIGLPVAPEGVAAQFGGKGVAPFSFFDQCSAAFLMNNFSIGTHREGV